MSDSKCPGDRPSWFNLFSSFLRLGITAFGGPAMVAYIRRMAVEQKHWLDEATFRDGVALCQAIPGATAMQTSAYVGLRSRGVRGAAASFIGFGLPAFLLMVALSALYARHHTLPAVVSAFHGLRAIIVAIVAHATVSFGRRSLKEGRDVAVAALAAILFAFRVNPILVILLAALLGVALRARGLNPSPAIDSTRRAPSKRPVLLLLVATGLGFLLLFLVNRDLFDLAALMSRIDLFAFGGGFASVPLMFHEIVEVRGWMDGTTFLDGIVLGQITPGPIVITATFVGYLLRGPLGALIATIGVFLPSFLILIGIVPHFDRLRTSSYFQNALNGSLCSFVGLLLTVTYRFAGNVEWDGTRILLAIAALIALLLEVDILWVVLAGTAISVAVL
ncbi:MAG: chromate efflux transporter [candidate division NC10 bacterium]|nr:chromate efflux transporter [candidate division NC10 bacterium]